MYSSEDCYINLNERNVQLNTIERITELSQSKDGNIAINTADGYVNIDSDPGLKDLTAINTGNHNNIKCYGITDGFLLGNHNSGSGPFRYAYIRGDDCYIATSKITTNPALTDKPKSMDIDPDVFAVGKRCSCYGFPLHIIDGTEVTEDLYPAINLVSKHPLKQFFVGPNSVVVAGWHDGVRQRYTLHYAGVDFEACKHYKSDNQGNLILIPLDENGGLILED